jgi:hypothetical protein
MLLFSHRRGVESVTYGMIDTLFLKMDFPAKNMRFNQCSSGFYDFSKIAFFAGSKKTIFAIAFGGSKMRVPNGHFLPALDR